MIEDHTDLIYQFTIVLIFLAAVIFYLSMFFYSKRLTSSIIRQKEIEQDLMISNFNLEKVKLDSERYELEKLAQKEKGKRLQQETDLKSKQLVSNTLLLSQQFEVLSKIDEQLKEISKAGSPKVKSSSAKIRRAIKANLSLEDNWKNFKIQFEQLHPDFFERLSSQFPKLTSNDMRHCAFIKMRMNTKEIARMLSINPTSVQISRVRLKKKMELGANQDLKDYLLHY